jgi:hypothetical protein
MPHLLNLLVGLLMVAAAALYMWPGMVAPLNIYDEGLIVFGAVRVLQGEMPYRDFWTQYSPGQLYVLAALFKVFGTSIMVERWWDVVSRAVLALALSLVAGRLASRKAALAVWLLAVMWLQYYGFFGYPIFQGLAFSLLSMYAMLRAFESVSARWLFAAGGLLGLAFIFRHDMAVYVGAAQLLVLLPLAGRFWVDGAWAVVARAQMVLRRLLPYVAGAACVAAPVIIFFVAVVPMRELAQQLFIFPLVEFPKVRDLPYPPLKWRPEDLPFYAPFLIFALAGMVVVAGIGADRSGGASQTVQRFGKFAPPDRSETRQYAIAMLILFGLFGFNQARVRSDTIHTVHFFLVSATLLPVLWRGFGTVAKPSALSSVISLIGLTLFVALLVNPLDRYKRTLEARRETQFIADSRNSLPVAQGVRVDLGQQFAVGTIKTLTRPADYVYVGLLRHDRVFANDVMFYFLMQRRSPTRYHELHPGLVNTAPVQQEMVADLERHQVKYVVLTDMFEGAKEPNDSGKSSGVTFLDDYIKKNYRLYAQLGTYRVLRRR